MRLSKFMVLVACLTLFSLLYVWQQTEILRFAYAGQKHLVKFQDLLDKNSSLRYNLKRNTSLTCIGSKIFDSRDFQMPESYCLVQLPSSGEGLRAVSQNPPKRVSLAYRLFGIKREAEAKTIESQRYPAPKHFQYPDER